MNSIMRQAAIAAVLGATMALGHPGRARGAFPASYTSSPGFFGPRPRPRLGGNWPGKTFNGNGPREVARRLRQIARGQLSPVIAINVPAHATPFQVAA